MEQGTGFLQVAIDFPSSHHFFPSIMHWVLLGLAVLIAIVHGREIAHNTRANWAARRASFAKVDKLRLGGTLVLLLGYFLGMNWIGAMFPNQGFGFLFVSMPFMFLLSLLYVHALDGRKFALLSVTSIGAPLIVWYVLGRLFWITLP